MYVSIWLWGPQGRHHAAAARARTPGARKRARARDTQSVGTLVTARCERRKTSPVRIAARARTPAHPRNV